ncbi:MAG: DUF58 domain-containing protein [Anaerolineales bacterium]
MTTFLPLLIVLMTIAALMRDDFSLTLAYLFVGVTVLGTWWERRSLAQVKHERRYNEHAFLDEQVEINLRIHNQGWLPVLWVGLQDSLPVALGASPFFQQVLSLGPGARTQFNYSVYAKKRGYYPIGPLFISGGDVLGLNKPQRLENKAQHLTVYPKIIPLSSLQIPSRSPQGTLRHTQQIFEDPTRVFSKREYTPGDSLRRVDWKASASSGRLQIKLFEPSIALEALIFLDLNSDNYHPKYYFDATELAIVIAASVASWICEKRQTVGMKINGQDPLAVDGVPPYMPPRKGQAQLMRMLEILARIQIGTKASLTEMIHQQRHHLSWGTTLIIITGKADTTLLDELFQARRAGQNVMLILAGPPFSIEDSSSRAAHFGIPVVAIRDERGLDIWRK